MASQHGICTDCKHSFVLPAGTRAEDVKCPKCGGGVKPARASAAGTEKPAGPKSSTSRTGTGAPRSTAPGNPRGKIHAREAEPPKKGALPLVLAGAGLALAALAVWFFVSRGPEAEPATSAAETSASIDLSQLPDQAPLEGTTEEEWASLNELMTKYRTPPFSPASVPFGDRLMIQGKRAIPAILNGFKRLDLTTREGADIGWKIQTLLLRGLCSDADFGWRRENRPVDVQFNQQVIQTWFRAWEIAGEDDELWAEIALHKGIPPGLAKASGDAAAPREE